jgi:hypothetical protein
MRRLRGVRSATPVTGPYDLIALVEAGDTAALGALVARLHRLPHVLQTTTNLVVG